ncbi:MAG TPA: response regulator [Burkholderiales bacterium]|nr:response regulator [Burkholderiales bacterium]
MEAVVRQRAEAKGLSFRLEAGDGPPEGLHADERKLRQVLMNLLSNAVKYTQSGEVLLRVSGDDRDCASRSPIPESAFRLKKYPSCFNLSRNCAIWRRPEEGTGLGLAISQRLVGMMGGEPKVTSTPGRGNCFWFDLPCAEAIAPLLALERDPAIAGYRGPPRRILIVDDKPINRRVLRGLLKPLAFEYSEVADGEHCLRQVAEVHPELILINVIMPRLDGLETTRRLRRPGERVAIIAMSASVFEANRAQCLQAGCDDFIPKPVSPENLLDALQRSLKLDWIYQEAEPSRSRSNTCRRRARKPFGKRRARDMRKA